MHALMERPGTTDLDALLTELSRTPEGTMVIDQIRDRLSHHLARTGGNIISGNPRNLPWYRCSQRTAEIRIPHRWSGP